MSAPIGIVRQPYAQVLVEGTPLGLSGGTGNTVIGPEDVNTGILSVHTSYGFDLRVAEATIVVTGKPARLAFNQQVVIRMAASQGNALGPSVARFVGTIVEFDYTHWPRDVSILCRGPLYRAQTFELPNPGPGSIGSALDPFPDMGGFDMSNSDVNGNPLGQTDQQMVMTALDTAGVGFNQNDIGGTGKTFGTVIPEHMRWPVGQSALNFIDSLDQVCLGYRTFDAPGGIVKRALVSIIPSDIATWTFTEGVDILSGTGSDEILSARGHASVTGGTVTGSGLPAFKYKADAANPYNAMIDTVTSAYLEKSLIADAGPGLSCQEVANWRITQVQYPLLKRQFETPLDYPISPGDTVRINAPLRLGTSRTYWVQRVEADITEAGVFTQKLTCVGLGS